MAYKLIEAARSRWHAVNAPHLVVLVQAGATFEKGNLVERASEHDQEVAALTATAFGAGSHNAPARRPVAGLPLAPRIGPRHIK
jgi:hypothetical protein